MWLSGSASLSILCSLKFCSVARSGNILRRSYGRTDRIGHPTEGQLSTVGSTDRRNTLGERLSGRAVEQGLSGSLVELTCDGAELCLAMQR